LRRFGALAVENGGRRAGLAVTLLAQGDIARIVNALQRAVPGPQLEIAVKRHAKGALTHFRCNLSALNGRNETGTEEVEFGAAIHLALYELQPRDLAFCLAV